MPPTEDNRKTEIEASQMIYQSPPSEPDDNFWLEQGRKMLTESLTNVRSAAGAMMTGLSALQGIYLGILGFAKFIPEETTLVKKWFFVAPLLCWMIALYQCLRVMMTELLEVNLNSPTDIREQNAQLLRGKQGDLSKAFWWLFAGLMAAFVMLVLRLKL